MQQLEYPMIVMAVLLQAAVSATGPAAVENKDIVIVGRSIDGARSSLAACIARACPPDQEIKAAIILAAREFLAGDYVEARRTLLASRGRNAKFAKNYPLQVSDLHRALNRLSVLDGRLESARLSAFDATDALKSGLPADDPQILLQRLDTARQLVRESRIVAAAEIFNDVAAKARKSGRYDVEAQALFRAASVYAALGSVNPDYRPTARRWMTRIEQRAEPEFAEYRDGLILLEAEIAALKAKPANGGRDVRPLPAMAGAVLVHEPVVDFGTISGGRGPQSGGNTDPEWADVGFWVRPDGSVGDLHVLEQSKSRPGSWLAAKTKAVADRRYAPLKGVADPRGLYRVERYSMVYPLIPSTESRIPGRSTQGTLDMMDITTARRPPPPDAD
ncbi:hypothetical protein LPN01_06065 [Sphingomonas sp. A2-49]|uniref:hypothetical protein n=1 Tax=Sphingomonas sp. A2-49 TaxID=1391375 RepID=UPI0021CEE16D|nr:hypothetical protein [Sphingomonas sp. A2-49]MCU6453636.1 hypothetical protein [Sphingomonas sp. A2-49]